MSSHVAMPRLPRVLVLLLLAGCSTQSALRESAKRTSDQAIDLADDLERTSQASRVIAETRDQQLRRLEIETGLNRARFDQDQQLANLLGRKDLVERYKEFQQLDEQQRQKEKAAVSAAEQDSDDFRKGQVELQTKSSDLRQIGSELLEVAKADNGAERAKFLVGFVSEVNNDIQKATKDAEEKAKKAREQAASAGGQVQTAMTPPAATAK